MAKIREILVNRDDIEEMLGRNLNIVDIDAHHVYSLSDILSGDEPTILCWDRHMRLEGPGELQSPGAYCLDYGGAMRQMLTPYVQGLEHCSIGLFFGDLLEEKRRDKWVLEVKPFAEAKHTIVIIRWPAAEPISYFDADLSSLKKDFGLRFVHETLPGGRKDESYGEDVLVLQSDLLNGNFWEHMQEYDSFRTAVLEDEWIDFEVSRGYYRAEMEKLQKLATSAQLQLDFQEDFAWIRIGKGDMAEAFTKITGTDALGRCWYTSDGLAKLHAALALVAPAASLYDVLCHIEKK